MKNSANPLGGETVTIIGSFVYRGKSIPGLQGKYIFGSFSNDFGPTGEIFISNPAGPGLWSFSEMFLENSADDRSLPERIWSGYGGRNICSCFSCAWAH